MTKLHMSLIRHSGLDPWFDRPFDRLTVLSEVEGLTVLSEVEGLTVLSEVEGLTVLSKPVESLKVERVEGLTTDQVRHDGQKLSTFLNYETVRIYFYMPTTRVLPAITYRITMAIKMSRINEGIKHEHRMLNEQKDDETSESSRRSEPTYSMLDDQSVRPWTPRSRKK